MQHSKSKWLAYTVLVGLIPVFSRVLVWTILDIDAIAPFAPGDFVAFGLVLHISNINELEHASAQGRPWKTIQNGVSLIFIALYSVILAVLLLAERSPKLVNSNAVMICVTALATTSFLLSLSVFHRLSYSTKSAKR